MVLVKARKGEQNARMPLPLSLRICVALSLSLNKSNDPLTKPLYINKIFLLRSQADKVNRKCSAKWAHRTPPGFNERENRGTGKTKSQGRVENQ